MSRGRKAAGHKEIVAVLAVLIEIVSDAKFPVSRENTGNFIDVEPLRPSCS
jgi:hypothetical protein